MPRPGSLSCNWAGGHPRASVWPLEQAARRVMAVRRDGLVGRPESRRHIICSTAIMAWTG